MQTLPNLMAPFIGKAGTIIKPWIQYLQQFTQAPPAILVVSVGSSPFSYLAKEPGFVVVTGGVVTGINLNRGSVVINLTGQVIIPVSINDIVTVTYIGLPTIQFIPTIGASTQ